MDYTRFLSKCTNRNRKNLIRKMMELFLKHPNSITLATGMPNAKTFPLEEISFKYKGGQTVTLKDSELSASLQYSAAQGHPPLREKMREFQDKWHAPERKEWDVLFTVGSQDGCFKIFKTLLDEGETVLMQTPTYPGIMGAFSLCAPVMDFDNFYSRSANERQIMLVNTLACSKKIDIQLGEGKNNPTIIPVERITIRFKDCEPTDFDQFEMSEALNLGQAQGCKPFLKRVREMQRIFHRPSGEDWDVLAVTGAQDGMDRVFQTFLNRADAIMVQVPVYFGVIGAISPLDPVFIGIPQDAGGIIPKEIARVCEERRQSGKPMPKLLYVNPTGANPTGSCLSEDRKREIYELARKYDFLIVEDDAYFFLHFLDQQPRSFFSMDTEGRVIRLDSFSKILSAGIRLGVVTAHKNLIQKFVVHVENSILHTSSLSQMLVYKLFETWSPQRFEQHFKEIQSFYKEKRDIMIAAVEKHLTGLAEWSVPKGGMFVWLQLKGIHNVKDLVMDKCVANGVFVLPGNAFSYDSKSFNQHLRLCYSYATEKEIDEGLSIVARLIREEISKTNGTLSGLPNGVSKGMSNGVLNGVLNEVPKVSNGVS